MSTLPVPAPVQPILPRREKGPDHEETLAHLAALALHLENTGKHTEAAEFKREHDKLAAQVEAKKKEKIAGS